MEEEEEIGGGGCCLYLLLREASTFLLILIFTLLEKNDYLNIITHVFHTLDTKDIKVRLDFYG